MNRHLSSDEIANWAIGERTGAGERHAGECSQCKAELERLDNALSLFCESARQGFVPQVARRPRGWMNLVLAGALAAAVLLGVAMLRTPKRLVLERTREEPFFEIPYVAPLAPYERSEVMRMDVPVAALIAAGFEIHTPDSGGTVRADVLLGQDGRAHAIRPVPFTSAKELN